MAGRKKKGGSPRRVSRIAVTTSAQRTRPVGIDYQSYHRAIADSAIDAIVVFDARNTISFVNSAAENLFGHSSAKLLGRGIDLLIPDCPRPTTGQRAVLRGRHRDERNIPLEVSFGEYRHDGQHQFVAVMRDISERLKADELRTGQGRMLEMIASAAPLEKVLTELTLLIESQSEGMRCSVLLLDETGARLRHGAAPSLPAAYVKAIDGVPIGPNAGSCGTAAYLNEPVIVTDVRTDPLWDNYRELPLQYGLRACWSTPIRSRQNKVMGTFAMYYAQPRQPSPRELHLIDIATQIAGIAIERERAEAILYEREGRIRRLVDSNIIGVVFWNTRGDVWDANDAFLKLVGYTREDLAAGTLSFSRITPVEYRQRDEQAIEEIRRTGRCTPYEKAYLHKDQRRVPVLIGGTFLEGSQDRGVAFVLDLTERKSAEEKIRHMAQHDALTGLPNRLVFRDRVGQSIAQAHRNRQQLAVLFIDLDHFKDINDSLGHQVGDQLLKAVARRLQRCLREGDSVARLGGDEFVISLPALSAAGDSMLIAGKVLEALRRPFVVEHHQLHVGGSIGISLYPENGTDADALMRAADAAMYHAKEKGRDNYQFFVPRLNEAAHRRLKIANRLHRAVQHDEFVLHYQPQINLATGRIVSAEALIRWRQSDIGMVSPLEFVKVAEETGLIVPLGEWVVRQACQQLKEWRDVGYPDLRITVNISPHQLRRPGFDEFVSGVLKENQIPPQALEIEITEGILMMYTQESVTTLGRLTRTGVRLAIDDFGTGYSGLAYLQRFPINVLKIDQSFVSGIGEDPNDTAIVGAIIAMANSLNLEVVAEGVETAEQAQFLREHGCFAAQGFYYSKAVAPRSFIQLMGKQESLPR